MTTPSDSVAPRGRPNRTLRWWLNQLHLWVGLTLCVPLVLLGLTGSITVFEHELQDLFDPPPRARSGEARSVTEIVAAARAEAPEGTSPSFYMAPTEPGDAAIVRFAQRGGAPGPGGLQVFVDPVSLDVLGVRDANAGLLRQIRMLHANLLMRDRTGREIIGWLGVVMCGLGMTGLVLWWPRPGQWRGAFSVRRGAHGVRLHRELHGAVGIWFLLVFITVSFSGTYLAFPQTIGAAISSILPARDLRATPAVSRVVEGSRPRPIDPGEALALARAAMPDGTLRFIAFPNRPDQPLRVTFLPPGGTVGQPMVTVFIDQSAHKVVELRDPRQFTAGESFQAWQHALHAGEGLGWLWQGLVFVSGFLPLLFVITGLSMWWMKRRARLAATARRDTVLEAAE